MAETQLSPTMFSIGLKRTFSASRTAANVASTSRAASSVPSRHSRSENRPTLDADTKRKLISLYHQSISFITPESLSAHIDAEFARKGTEYGRLEEGISFLKEELDDRRTLPKMTTVNSSDRFEHMASVEPNDASWSGGLSARSRAAKAALYGVDSSLKAGLETVEEYRATLPERRKGVSGHKKRRS